MKDYLKGKTVTLIIVIAVIILAGIAIFTATRLFQLRNESVSPAAPESTPGAQTVPDVVPSTCQLSFSLTVSAAACYESCTTSSDCPSGLECQDVAGQNLCVNPLCSEESSCVCETSTPTPSPTTTPVPTGTSTPVPATGSSPTPAPELPEAGTISPTLIGMGLGILVLLFSMALAL